MAGDHDVGSILFLIVSFELSGMSSATRMIAGGEPGSEAHTMRSFAIELLTTYSSSTSLTFRASADGVNGFCRSAAPFSSTPWRTMAFSV
jgi:hypothetical protein